MNLGELWVKLGVDMKGFKKALGDAKGQATGLGGGIKSALAQGAGFAAATIGFQGVGAAISGVVQTGVGFNAQMEQNKIAFDVMLGSGQKADAFLRDLASFAASTPFEFPELTDAAKKMMAYGFASQDVLPMLTDIGDAVAAMGAGSEGVDSVVRALGQMKAKGKVSAEEMNQLMEIGINGWGYVADAMGKPISEVQKLSEKGLVPAGLAIKAITDGMGKDFPDMMAKQSKSFNGLMSTLKDNVAMTLGGVLKPAFDNMTQNVLPGLISKVEAFANAFKSGGLTAAFKTIIPPDVVTRFQAVFDRIRSLWDTFMGALSSGKGDAKIDWLGILRDALDWLTVNLPKATPILMTLGDAIGSAFKWLTENGPLVMTILKAIVGGFAAFQVISTVVGVIMPIVSAIGTVIAVVVQMAAAFGAVGGGVSAAMGVLVAAVGGPVTLIVAAIAAVAAIGFVVWKNWDTIKVWLANTWAAISNGATVAWNAISAFFRQWGTTILAVITGPIGVLVLLLVKNWDKVKAGAQAAWNGIKTMIGAVWNGIVSWFMNMTLPGILISKWSSIRSAATTAWNAVKSSITGVWSSITGAVGNVVSTVTSKFSGLLSSAKNWGRNMLQNFISGVREKFAALGQVVSEAAGKVKNFLGFHSPTKEGPGSDADEWAPNFIDMFSGGIRKGLPQLQAAVNGMALTLQPNMAGVAAAGPSSAGLTWTGNLIVDGSKSPRETADEVMRELRRRGVRF